MLEIDLFNINKFIQVNNLQEVTNPVLLERDNIPTTDGLLSYDIFGRTSQDRSTIFAYINLNGHFIHPLVLSVLKYVNRKIEPIIAGIETFKVNAHGELEADENGWTGLEELYKHFDEIKFDYKNSNIQNERISFIKSLSKDEIFIDKWIVCPPFYRDLQLDKINNGKVSVHQKTETYTNILRLSRALRNDVSGIPIITHSTRNRIQQLLNECYSEKFMKEIKGKNGMFRKFVMGKSVDYGARFVISSALFDADSINDMEVSFEKSGLPLAGACVCFFPYFIKWLKDYFYKEIYLRKDKYPYMNKDGKIEYVRIIDADKYNDEFFTKAIDSYVHSYADRFKTISLDNDKGYDIKMAIVGQYANTNTNVTANIDSGIMKRPLTWTDLLYRAAVDICKDKHMLVTRYPLEDYFGIFATKIHVLSTIETKPMIISGTFYPNYPVIDPNLPTTKVTSLFRDTACMSNLYLAGLGADFDGDQVSVRGVWDINANRKCHEQIYAKKNILNIAGKIIRTTEKEALQTLYSLTSDSSEFIDFKGYKE